MGSAKLLHLKEKQFTILLIFIPLVLTAYTHLFNPVGFPSIHFDEGHYMRRVLHVMEGYGPQEERSRYDHPYFGQIFVASMLKTINYPSFLNPVAGSLQSIEMLYLVPRVLMGILAVFSTFLIYKIAEYRYNRLVAFVASFLFAVLPYTLDTRRVLLEPIQLPFLLLSILFAVYLAKMSKENRDQSTANKKKVLVTVLSGVFLGLAIFTKIPAFTLIPLVGYLVLKGNNNNAKMVALWLIPLVLIPSIWPLHALSLGQFDDWVDGMLYQTDRIDRPLFEHFKYLFSTDPLMVFLGIAGLLFALVKRDAFPLLWSIPYLVFLYVINYVSTFFFIPIFPAFCVASAAMIYAITRNSKLLGMLKGKKKAVYQSIMPSIAIIAIIAIIGVYGLTMDVAKVNSNVNELHLKTYQVATKVLDDHEKTYGKEYNVTVISTPVYFWIPQYVFHMEDITYQTHNSKVGLSKLVENPGHFLLILDRPIKDLLGQQNERADLANTLYDISTTAAEIGYRDSEAANKTNLDANEIKTSWQPVDTYIVNLKK